MATCVDHVFFEWIKITNISNPSEIKTISNLLAEQNCIIEQSYHDKVQKYLFLYVNDLNKIKFLDGFFMGNHELSVFIVPHAAALKIKNIPFEFTTNMLQEEFQRFGEVKKACILHDVFGNKTPTGVVEFKEISVAKDALAICTGTCTKLNKLTAPMRVEQFKVKYEKRAKKLIQGNSRCSIIRLQEQSIEYEFGMFYKEEMLGVQQQKKLVEKRHELRVKTEVTEDGPPDLNNFVHLRSNDVVEMYINGEVNNDDELNHQNDENNINHENVDNDDDDDFGDDSNYHHEMIEQNSPDDNSVDEIMMVQERLNHQNNENMNNHEIVDNGDDDDYFGDDLN